MWSPDNHITSGSPDTDQYLYCWFLRCVGVCVCVRAPERSHPVGQCGEVVVVLGHQAQIWKKQVTVCVSTGEGIERVGYFRCKLNSLLTSERR